MNQNEINKLIEKTKGNLYNALTAHIGEYLRGLYEDCKSQREELEEADYTLHNENVYQDMADCIIENPIYLLRLLVLNARLNNYSSLDVYMEQGSSKDYPDLNFAFESSYDKSDEKFDNRRFESEGRYFPEILDIILSDLNLDCY